MNALGNSAPSRLKDRNGTIIVMVLVFIVLLTFIVVAFMEEATSKIKYYGLFHNRDDLRIDAYSAMEISLAVINQYREVEGSLWGPEQGWRNPLQKFGFRPAHASEVEVTFEDESAKLPLSTMEYDDLLVLFDVMGFDLPDAEALADGLLDWTDEDDLRRLNGFDGEDYEDLDPPYKAANSAIVSWDEFCLIQPFNTLFFDEFGQPLPLWNQFKESISLYHTGKPNINHAPYLVRLVLMERGAINQYGYEDWRNGIDMIPGNEDDRLATSNNAPPFIRDPSAITTEIEMLRVKVAAIRGDARFELEAMVTWSGSNAGANRTESNENQPDRSRDVEESNPDSAADQRRRSRGSARTAPTAAAELGYPFRFLRITENRKF